ncbi:MAG: hypothetical protein QGH94_08385 [Phycisphaerae bacterium]|jgi:hypothetical protein|nr:hypothetical protein [Phycisphaerae bacterium]MDP7287997.1 hypothetical protein [Phycisphaerae bacterium]
MKDYVDACLKFLDMQEELLNVKIRDSRECLKDISAEFRELLNQGDPSDCRTADEARRIGVPVERLERAVEVYFRWRKGVEFIAGLKTQSESLETMIDEDGNEHIRLTDM